MTDDDRFPDLHTAPGDYSGSSTIEAGDTSDESDDDLEEMANAALRPMEAAGARHADWSAREYVEIIYGLDAAEYDDDVALLEAMSATDETGRKRPEESYGFEFTASDADADGMEPIQAERGDAAGIEEVAKSVLTGEELAHVEDNRISAAVYIEDETGVNPAAYPSEPALLTAISAARSDE